MHPSTKIESMADEQKERFGFLSRSHFDREAVIKVSRSSARAM
jgi:hypothetical protein